MDVWACVVWANGKTCVYDQRPHPAPSVNSLLVCLTSGDVRLWEFQDYCVATHHTVHSLFHYQTRRLHHSLIHVALVILAVSWEAEAAVRLTIEVYLKLSLEAMSQSIQGSRYAACQGLTGVVASQMANGGPGRLKRMAEKVGEERSSEDFSDALEEPPQWSLSFLAGYAHSYKEPNIL